MAQIKTRIILRNDSTANWLLNEGQVLLKGEVGIEFLKGGKAKVKIGDGTKPWHELEYFGGETLKVNENTFVFDENGNLNIAGFAEAETGAQLSKGTNGELVWKVPELAAIEERLGTPADSEQGTPATGVYAELENKANITDVYTKEETTQEISNALAELVGGADERYDTLKEIADYIKSDVTGTADLVNRVTVNETKLATISEGAEANIIEVIRIGGREIPVNEKAVDLPLATVDAMGLVKSSNENNKILVAADGTMEVNNISISKLTQNEDELLILNGGDSAA